MMRKRKAKTKRKPSRLTMRIERLAIEIVGVRDKVDALYNLIFMLVEKHDRHYASIIGISLENERLRMNAEKKSDAAPTTQSQ